MAKDKIKIYVTTLNIPMQKQRQTGLTI